MTRRILTVARGGGKKTLSSVTVWACSTARTTHNTLSRRSGRRTPCKCPEWRCLLSRGSSWAGAIEPLLWGHSTPSNHYQPACLWLDVAAESDSQHEQTICIAHRVRRATFSGSNAALPLCPGRRGALCGATTQAVEPEKVARSEE